MKAFFVSFWAAIKKVAASFWAAIKKILTEIWAAITSEGKTIADWHLDPWKIASFGSFALAAYMALRALDLALAGKDAGVVGIIAGLAGTFVTTGTFLFGQSAKNDASIRGSGQ